jgi:hypothetical protein
MKQASIDIDGILQCPNCSSENLHQDSASVFFRDSEESLTGKFFRIDRTKAEKTLGDKNPSSRRDGLLIEFWCEECDADPILAIYQRKGYTYIHWHSMRKLVEA